MSMGEVTASGQSLQGSSMPATNATQMYEQTQMDVDYQGDTRLQQALKQKRSGLDAINSLESKIVKKTADRERQDKVERM